MHRTRGWTAPGAAGAAVLLLAACGQTGSRPDETVAAVASTTPTAEPQPTPVAMAGATSDGPTSDFGFYHPEPVARIAGERPSAVAGGDLDGDGIPELVVTAAGSDRLVVLRTSQPLDAYRTYETVRGFPSGGDEPVAVVTADVDADSPPEVVVANAGSDEIAILDATGAGRLSAARTFPAGGREPGALAVGDLDADAHPDVVVVNAGSRDVAVLRGDGNGGFAKPGVVQVGGTPTGLVVTDVDGDDLLDVVVADADSDEVVLLRGDGDGGIEKPERFDAGVPNPRWLSTADLDGDGDGDLATASPDAVGVGILHGTADGLGPAALIERYRGGDKRVRGAAGIVLGRLDPDAHPDLAVADRDGVLWMFRGDPAGGLDSVGYERTTVVENGALELIDVNIDGGLDLVAAGSTDAFVTLSGDPPGCAGPPPGRAIVGTDGADTLVGTKDRDFIFGLGGDDLIRGGGGRFDLLCGGPGDDVVRGGPDSESLYGGSGNDRLYGGRQGRNQYGNSDGLYGDDGDDLLVAAGFITRMEGGAGDDALRSTSRGEGTLIGGPGDDSITPGPQDTVFQDDAPPSYYRRR